MTGTFRLLFWVLFMTLHHHPSHQNSPEMLGHAQRTAPHQHVLPRWWEPPYSLFTFCLKSLYHLTEEHSTCPGPEIGATTLHRGEAQPTSPPEEPALGGLLCSRSPLLPPGHFKCPDLPPTPRSQQTSSHCWIPAGVGGSGKENLTQRREHELSDVQRSMLGVPIWNSKAYFPTELVWWMLTG